MKSNKKMCFFFIYILCLPLNILYILFFLFPGEQNNQDCVMLLESVQCEVDPTSLMLEDPPEPDPQPEIGPDIEDDDDDDVVDLGEK